MSDKSFRIRTNVNNDKCVHVNLSQDIDFLEILSLKINQADTYKLHVSNYGIIVGRVLANENFGIPNAKVSVFINIDDEDKVKSNIKNLYPYATIHDKNEDGIRYNLLPDSSNDECYKVVGTFPNKRLVLDNDTEIEIFDKYWKYTTVTNKSGDYMIFGVPTGNQTVHVDIDLSDIGILSQKPIDFMYKGYNITQFDNARQFKDSTNLDNLSQILSQNNSVHVYPFWGDENTEEIAISRCDIQVQYKFESTCVFFGSIISDNYNNNINHKCSPSKKAGFNRYLVTGEGTIEMIRKTPDNLVEEYQIQGNRLIDGDGIWCYQIPMNLDYVGTDEFGNIVPTDDPKKGIATRTSVRFRVSMQETNNEGISRHRAKYLIPNVQKIVEGSYDGNNAFPHIEDGKHFEDCYEFGSATPDEYFRDLYWNKVYSVKNYIPRIQTNGKKDTQNYSAIRTVNNNGNLNPVPFNHARFKLVFAYRVLCMIMTIVIFIISVLNTFLSNIVCLKILWVRPFKFLCRWIKCISISGGLTEDIEDNVEFFPGCKRSCGCMMKCHEKGCEKKTDKDELINVVQQTLSQEYDTVNLDFYNDWLNGSMYLPLWFWKKTKKKKFLFGLFSKKAVNTYCSCSNHYSKLRVTQNCSLPYNEDYSYDGDDRGEKYHYHFPDKVTKTYFGVIKEFENKAGLKIYYYAPGLPNTYNYKITDGPTPYVRLYSTDIILLGSLNDCDLDNYPSVFMNLPSTTANVPFIATIKHTEEEDDPNSDGKDKQPSGYVEITGMDWLHEGEKGRPKYGAGLLMDLACNAVYTKPKSCINVERMSELGVSLDTHEEFPKPTSNSLKYDTREADGMITRYEIGDHETRAMFASLNHNGLQEKILNPNTGYYSYKLRYIYPNDFDGHLRSHALAYTKMMRIRTYDYPDENYINYRFGTNKKEDKKYYYSKGSNYTFPLFNNSFYFYFGLNEGKTAIDKFNNKFYSQCYKHTKYPFNINVTSEAGKWCPKKDTDYGSFIVNASGIKLPLSYVLYDEFNNEIMSEKDIPLEEIRFGYDIVKNGGAYVINDKGEYKKYGKLKYFNSGEIVKDNLGREVLIENGIFKLKIIDANGNFISHNINIEQIPINLTYETIDLDEKYYEDITKSTDLCGTNCNDDKHGSLIINNIIIDGKEYYIHDFDNKSENVNGIYNINVYSKEDWEKIKFTINHQNVDKYPNFNDCICKSCPNNDNPKIENGKLIFKIWVPGNYSITINQYCFEDLNDNFMQTTITINNGKPFNAYINDVPLRFILGKNEDIANYNNKFYWNDNSNKLDRKLKNSSYDYDGWFALNDEATYSFPNVDISQESVWSDFVNARVDYLLDDDGNPTDKRFYDEDSINEIVMYKYNCLFNMCKSFYVVDSSDNSMTISHSGGRGVILFKGTYPKYDEPIDGIVGQVSSNIHLGREINARIIDYDDTVDNIGSVTVDANFPNIISKNYSVQNTNENQDNFPLRVINDNMDYNPTIQMPNMKDFRKQGNYFAAFTMNGCLDNNGKQISKCKYKAVPHLSKPNASSFNDVIINNDKNKKYFRGQFIDRRLDYSFLLITPYSGNEIKYVDGKDDDNSWMLGRLSGNTFNGIEMCYDNQTNYNIIGKKTITKIINGKEIKNEIPLEYDTDIDYNGINNNGNIIKLNKDVSNKRFYKTILKCGNKSYNIVDCMHGTANRLSDGLESKKISVNNGEGFNITTSWHDYPMVRGCDIVNIPTSNKVSFICSSCSYNSEIGIEEGDNNTIITGATEEIGETEFTVSTKDMISNQLSSLDECAANNDYNVSYYTDSPITTIGISGKKEFTPNNFKLSCKLMADNINNEHQQYTTQPMLFNIRHRNKDNTYYNLIKDIKNKNSIEDIRKTLIDFIEGYFNYESTNEKLRLSSPKKGGSKLGYGFISDIFNEVFGHFWTDDGDIDKTLMDNTTDFRNILFKIEVPLKIKSGFINIDRKLDLLSVGFIRNYINASDDNLTKEISTVQFTSIYDIRKFSIYCSKCEIVEISDTETDVPLPPPPPPTPPTPPESGGTENGGEEKPNQKINENPPSEENEDSKTVSGKTKVQYVRYSIIVEDDPDINQEFRNFDSISASLRIDINKKESKLTNNVILSSSDDGKEIYLDTYWSGDLAGIYVSGEKGNNQKITLFLQMPNKLIYRLKFTHNKMA